MNNHKERRDSGDRRQEECGPPQGWKDRRRRTERRMPEIGECEMSEAEWLAYFGADRQAAAVQTAVITEAASSVFERSRD